MYDCGVESQLLKDKDLRINHWRVGAAIPKVNGFFMSKNITKMILTIKKVRVQSTARPDTEQSFNAVHTAVANELAQIAFPKSLIPVKS